MGERRLVWSYGGGTQSVAIAVLVAQGRLPLPERIVMADTGHERHRTWDYLHAHVGPLLATVGRTVEVVTQRYATVGLQGKDGRPLLPAFAGADAALPTFCSNEWKRRVLSRYLRAQGYGPRRPIDLWIGYSVDELARARPSDVAWQAWTFPLLFTVPLRRAECRALVQQAGLPDPPRSSCYFCPLHRDEEWREIRDEEPGDWRQAVAYDATLRTHGLALHRSMVPLAEAPIAGGQQDPDQLGLALPCGGSACYT